GLLRQARFRRAYSASKRALRAVPKRSGPRPGGLRREPRGGSRCRCALGPSRPPGPPFLKPFLENRVAARRREQVTGRPPPTAALVHSYQFWKRVGLPGPPGP